VHSMSIDLASARTWIAEDPVILKSDGGRSMDVVRPPCKVRCMWEVSTALLGAKACDWFSQSWRSAAKVIRPNSRELDRFYIASK